jgi:hypothetical protein
MAREARLFVLPMCCSRAESAGSAWDETARKERGLEWSRGLDGQPGVLVGVFPSLETIQIPFPADLPRFLGPRVFRDWPLAVGVGLTPASV